MRDRFTLLALVLTACSGRDLVINTTALPAGEVGAVYQAAITAAGGSGEGYVWQITSGALPAGLELDGRGTPSAAVSGSPSEAGTFDFEVEVTDTEGHRATGNVRVVIEGGELPAKLEIVTTALPDGEVTVPYEVTVEASGGSEQGYAWRVSDGALPSGLTLAESGTPSTTLFGTPAEQGIFPITISVTDSNGATASVQIDLRIGPEPPPPALVIAAGDLPAAVAGFAYSTTVAAAGGSEAGYAWTVSSGALPDGLVLARSGTPATTIAGTPTSTGARDFTITVADDAGGSASQAFMLEVVSPVTIATTALPGGREGAIYSTTVEASGGSGAGYQWSVVQGSLPPGLTLAPSGTPATTISGSPTDWGAFTFTIRVDEPLGSFAERELTIDLLPAPVEIDTTTVPIGEALSPYAALIDTVNGSLTGYSWSATGALPPGLALDPTGTPPFTSVAGTPMLPGTYTATITVVDGLTGDSDSQVFTFEIRAPPITIVPTSIPTPAYGTDYSTTITAAGGSGSGFTWSVQGPLPRGLALDPNGTPSTTLSGHPIEEGSFDFTVAVQDSFGTVETQRYTGEVARALTVLTRAVPIVDAGGAYSTSLTAAGGTGTGYTWDLQSGALPSGLNLLPAGTPTTLLAGSTSARGFHTFTVRVTDSSGTSASATLHMQVRAPQSVAAIVGDLAINGDVEVYLDDLLPGTTPLRISPAGSGTGDASPLPANVQFSPDHSHVAYVGDFATDGSDSLYTVYLFPSVGLPFRVSGPLVANADVTDFAWSPDSEQLVFRADKLTDGVYELFWIDMRNGSSAATRISGAMAAGGNVSAGGYFWSPDSTKVVYHADQNADEVYELFVVDLAGSTAQPPQRVNRALAPNGDAGDTVLFLSDGDGLVYWAEEEADELNGIYLASIAGGTVSGRTRLNVRNAVLDRGDLSTDGRLLFVSDDDVTNAGELYVVDLLAPVPRAHKVNPPLLDQSYDVQSGQWSPDSRRILYVADHDLEGRDDLFVVDADGLIFSAPERVNFVYGANSDVDADPIDGYAWSPDNRWAGFIVDGFNDGVFEVWITDVNVRPMVSQIVSTQLGPAADAVDFLFSPNSRRIAFRADRNVDGQLDLFSCEISANNPTPPAQVNAPLPAGGNVISSRAELRWSRDSQTIYYEADQTVNNIFEAYGVTFTGATPNAPFVLHGVLPASADVNTLKVQQP